MGKTYDDGRYEKWLIRLPQGTINLTIDKIINVRAELTIGQAMEYYCGIELTPETESLGALDNAIVIGRHPY